MDLTALVDASRQLLALVALPTPGFKDWMAAIETLVPDVHESDEELLALQCFQTKVLPPCLSRSPSALQLSNG